jgi:isoquinoline 1-oxidoreductase
MGQGARTELAQAAAEEIARPLSQVQMVLADTALVPDDGLTAGSRTSPSTVPAVRQGAAAARELLTQLAARKWNVDPATLQVEGGKITHQETKQNTTFASLAASGEAEEALKQAIRGDITLTAVEKWRILGTRPSDESTCSRHGHPPVSFRHEPGKDAVRKNPAAPWPGRHARLR